MQVSHVHPFQYTVSDERLSIFLSHEEDSILLKVNGAIASHHFSVILQRSHLDFWVFWRYQILQVMTRTLCEASHDGLRCVYTCQWPDQAHCDQPLTEYHSTLRCCPMPGKEPKKNSCMCSRSTRC